MESTLMNALLEFGAMGLFAAFLVWQHLSMQKRFDKLIDGFQEQLKAIREKYESSEDKLRDRYDVVIQQYQKDKTTFRVSVAAQIEDVLRKLGETTKAVEDLPFSHIQIQIEAVSLALSQSKTVLDKIMEIKNKKLEEEKIKEMARKMSGEKT